MNILVTGTAGYVGSICAGELVREKHRVIGYDNLTAGHREALAPGVRFVEGDIADTRKLKQACRKYRIDAVMHFAASILAGESTRDPHSYYRNNVSVGIAENFHLKTGTRAPRNPPCVPWQ